MPTTKEELGLLLAKRDQIEFEDAMELVNSVQEQIDELFEVDDDNPYGLFEVIEDLIACELGLEPDYMELFLENIDGFA